MITRIALRFEILARFLLATGSELSVFSHKKSAGSREARLFKAGRNDDTSGFNRTNAPMIQTGSCSHLCGE